VRGDARGANSLQVKAEAGREIRVDSPALVSDARLYKILFRSMENGITQTDS